MKKQFLLFFLAIVSFFSSHAQTLKSPAEFLGYELGSKYTPHYKIVAYFQHAVAAMPRSMQLEQYGTTNEGRPLLLATIASPENLARIEEIRKNNLRLTGMLNDKAADPNAPAIVWLSYNVHGNETSSSEAAMKTLYELLNPQSFAVNDWLKNTVVIIDPCLNPDGRDRFVNWYMQQVGKTPNPNLDAREHSEPWPNGRSNHYNFDLNRDWAWQTQVESQQRLVKYNNWMPQIHVDFHEQGVNDPYYFAPAAEPLHEVITQWQKDFQVTIGRNHARYFDANGWLFFTKERFDLFYPAYGDTYPLYNGAIGMTYEQASSAGLMAMKNDGDTLTLADGVIHHFTTGMSTIEITSRNAGRVISEFKKFFDDANAGRIGDYKTYIITERDNGKLAALKTLFERNGIRYGAANVTAARGYNFFTGKEENFTASNALAVSAYQPKAALIKVLFEPQSKLPDSLTYDITAWSIPYAYGIPTYGVKERISVGTYTSPVADATIPSFNYGWLVKYTSLPDAKFLAALLNARIRTRFAERDFSYNGKQYMKGTLIILKKGNEDKIQQLTQLAAQHKPQLTAVSSGFMDAGFDFGSDKLHFAKTPNVAMLTGRETNSRASGVVWHLFDNELEYPITLINADEIGWANLRNIDVLILPDGNYKFFNDKDITASIKTWVQQGGKIIAMENAAEQIAKAEWIPKLKKAEDDKDKKDDKDLYADVRRYEDRERTEVSNFTAGAIYKVELDNSHPLAFGYPNYYFTLKEGTGLFEFAKDGWNVGVIKKDKQVAGFVGSAVKDKIKDGTVIGVQPMGSGTIVYFAENPIFRSFWENGKMMVANAVFLVGQ